MKYENIQGKRVVLAGDHKQLPPTIKSRNQGLSVTLFDRVLKEFEPEKVSRLLRVQYRMNEQIMEWSSKYVYNGQLKAHDSVAHHSIGGTGCESNILLFIDTAGAKMGESINDSTNDRNKSKSNQGEADLVKIIFDELKIQGIDEKEIGVITPYNAQVDLIKKLFENNNINTQKVVEVSTVDGFQGREKECIIISMVRSNPLKQVGFLSDYRRMNVAVTRARKFVCLIGDSDTVSSDKFLGDMVQYFEEHGETRSAMEYVGMEDVHFNVGFIDEKAKKELKTDSSIASTKPNVVKDKDQTNKKQKQAKKEKSDKPNQQIDQQQQNIPQKTKSTFEGSSSEQIPRKQFSEEDLKIQYTQEISVFLLSKATELKYEQINSFQRRVLHELAESYNLAHESIGTTTLKDIILRKIPSQKYNSETANPYSENQLGQVGLNNNHNDNDEDEEIKDNNDQNQSIQLQTKKQKKKEKKKELKSKLTSGILIGSSLDDTNKKTEVNNNELQPQQKIKLESAPVLSTQSAVKVTISNTAAVDDQKNQYQEYIAKKQQEQEEKLKQQLQLQEQQKKQKEQQKKLNKQKKDKKDEAEEEIDDLAFLEKLAEDKKNCKHIMLNGKKCGVYVEILGSDCKYCHSRYCIKHGLPEDHGCGERVKKDAREAFEKQFMMQHRGEKPLRQDQLNNLQSRLQDKIKSNIDGRKAKQPEKKKKK